VKIENLLIGGLFLTSSTLSCQTKHEKNQKPNVFFIAVDDLCLILVCYSNTQLTSLNMDKFVCGKWKCIYMWLTINVLVVLLGFL